jgi:hypothetical protein
LNMIPLEGFHFRSFRFSFAKNKGGLALLSKALVAGKGK